MTNYSAWGVSPTDFPAEASIDRQIAFLCRYAILAPSVHNVQTWRFEVSGGGLRIDLAEERTLESGDPTGGESWLSIGAAIENLLVAAEFFGLSASVTQRDAGSVSFEFTLSKPKPESATLLAAIVSRASNRAPYSQAEIASELLDGLADIARPGVQVLASGDRKLIELIADLTGRAIAIALGNPSFRHELSSLVHSSWTKKSTGMPAFSLEVSGARSLIENILINSGTRINAQRKKEYDLLLHSEP